MPYLIIIYMFLLLENASGCLDVWAKRFRLRRGRKFFLSSSISLVFSANFSSSISFASLFSMYSFLSIDSSWVCCKSSLFWVNCSRRYCNSALGWMDLSSLLFVVENIKSNSIIFCSFSSHDRQTTERWVLNLFSNSKTSFS